MQKYQIEAAIVRIMKARKKVEHNDLISQVLEQLGSKFKPSVIVVKKRIEALIEREYLERDLKERSFYNYLA